MLMMITIFAVLFLLNCEDDDDPADNPADDPVQKQFTVTIKNITGGVSTTSGTGTTGNEDHIPSPFAPVGWAVHTSEQEFFEEGGIASPGLKLLAEKGSPAGLAIELAAIQDVTPDRIKAAGVNGEGATEGAGSMPLGPDDTKSFTFTFTAVAGDRLSFAFMLVASNDYFFSPDPEGIALFDDAGDPIDGDISDMVKIWNAGTEADEEHCDRPGPGIIPAATATNAVADPNPGYGCVAADLTKDGSDNVKETDADGTGFGKIRELTTDNIPVIGSDASQLTTITITSTDPE